jgi:predicted dehydrogenase
MKRILNVALIGASGYWAAKLLPNLLSVKGVRLRALVSHTTPPESLRPLAPSTEVLLTQDVEIVLEDRDIEGVVIATSTHTHYAIAKKALEAQKHVFLEKPPALTSREAGALARLAERQDRVVVVDHIYLHSKHVKQMDRMIQKGVIGEPLHFFSKRANFGLFRTDSDTLSDLGYHDIYLIRHLMGRHRPLRVLGSATHSFCKGQASVSSFHVDFAKGVSADVHLSWLSPTKDRRVIVAGTDGLLEYRGDRELILHKKKVRLENDRFISDDQGARVVRVRGVVNPLREVLAHFVGCALRGEESELCNLREGAETVRWQERIRRSMEDGKPIRL